MAEAVREAYEDLFRVNTSAQRLSKQDVINKFKTLSQGSISESVLDKMAMTFTALVKLGDFDSAGVNRPQKDREENSGEEVQSDLSPDDKGEVQDRTVRPKRHSFDGLHYNIQIILPESRDSKVYDVLFKSLRDHLL